MTNNIVEKLFLNAEKYPEKIAIVHKNEKITYSRLALDVKKYAQYFLEKNLHKGDNVLIFVPMTIELYKILAAIFYIGAVAVFVDAWADKNRLNQALSIIIEFFLGIWIRINFHFGKAHSLLSKNDFADEHNIAVLQEI